MNKFDKEALSATVGQLLDARTEYLDLKRHLAHLIYLSLRDRVRRAQKMNCFFTLGCANFGCMNGGAQLFWYPNGYSANEWQRINASTKAETLIKIAGLIVEHLEDE